ncbi:MAG: hypothetical protein KC478_05025 [Bacteriovoracaceae bacterium]|nr:hypothetical protein [Bacteriovoracaceae bacterium]
MKRLTTLCLISSALFSFSAVSSVGISKMDAYKGAYSTLGAGATSVAAVTAAEGAVIGGVVFSTAYLATYAFSDENYNYEGLSEESLEVLAGQRTLEEQPNLSLLKDDLLRNQNQIELNIFNQTGKDIDLSTLSDEELARMALTISIQNQ